VRIGIALAVGVLLIAIAAGVTLSRAPLIQVRENTPFTHHELVTTSEDSGACQAEEVLPQDTEALRLGLTSVLGPKVAVEVLSGRTVLARGVHPGGWEGASVTIPVRPLPAVVAPVEVCFQISLLNGPVGMLGWPSSRAMAARAAHHTLPGRMHIEYLRTGTKSWWSMASTTAYHLGLGRAAAGTWNALLALGLVAALALLSSWLVIRELR
jgi:hypothetical protein